MTITKTYRINKILFTTILFLGIATSLTACSNSNNKAKAKYKTIQTLNQQQEVETGIVISAKTIEIKPETINSYGNIGVAASSGGFRGIHGSIDLATIGRIFKKPAAKIGQEIIVKKKSGQIVAITQASKETFKQGDAVKILVRNGEVHVIH